MGLYCWLICFYWLLFFMDCFKKSFPLGSGNLYVSYCSFRLLVTLSAQYIDCRAHWTYFTFKSNFKIVTIQYVLIIKKKE